MKDILNFIFQNITIFENPIFNILIIAIILSISFYTFFWIVGQLYDYGLISGWELGSLIHWLLRFSITFLLVIVIGTLSRLLISLMDFINRIL